MQQLKSNRLQIPHHDAKIPLRLVGAMVPLMLLKVPS
jgi:hypothetical protein